MQFENPTKADCRGKSMGRAMPIGMRCWPVSWLREFGKEDALAILDHHEASTRRSDDASIRESTAMDDFVNMRSVAKMEGVTSREEVERRAEKIIRDAIREGGSGANGTVPYHPSSRWMTRGVADDSDIDPKWGVPKSGTDGATKNSILVDAILGKPGADWSEEEARLVMSDPRYWHSSKREQRVADRVQDSYRSRFSNRTGGAVQVGAYTRDDGTNVTAHTRSAPSR